MSKFIFCVLSVGFSFREFRLGRVYQQLVEAYRAIAGLVAISDFLALDTECRPRHCRQALWTDVLFAMKAHAERALIDAAQRSAHVSQEVRFAVQIANGKFPLRGVLHFVECIRTFFNRDAFAIADELRQFCLLRLQNILKLVQFSFCHCLPSPVSFFSFFFRPRPTAHAARGQSTSVTLTRSNRFVNDTITIARALSTSCASV